MALRDTASKSDYTLETICALFLEELEEMLERPSKTVASLTVSIAVFPDGSATGSD
jgi:hypothetical protein